MKQLLCAAFGTSTSTAAQPPVRPALTPQRVPPDASPCRSAQGYQLAGFISDPTGASFDAAVTSYMKDLRKEQGELLTIVDTHDGYCGGLDASVTLMATVSVWCTLVHFRTVQRPRLAAAHPPSADMAAAGQNTQLCHACNAGNPSSRCWIMLRMQRSPLLNDGSGAAACLLLALLSCCCRRGDGHVTRHRGQ